MIYHVAGADNDWPPKSFLKTWGKALAPHFRSIHTHQFAEVSELPLGTYLFTDLEKQSVEVRAFQAQVWDQLASHGDAVRLLNHPVRALGRYDLLAALVEAGINTYRVWRLSEIDQTLRFPVFLRRERDHEGARTPLIETWDDLEEQATRCLMAGAPLEDLLVAEFCDTLDERGDYRKYSAFRVGERIVPRHLIFGRNWMLKYPDAIDGARLALERAYLEENPHETELKKIFDLAHIDYGRIDYALLEGRIQVWEINTNPIVTLPLSEYKPAHLEHQEWFAERILEAFHAIDLPPCSGRVPIRLRYPAREPVSA